MMCARHLEARGPPAAAHNIDTHRPRLANRWRLLGLKGWSLSGKDALNLERRVLKQGLVLNPVKLEPVVCTRADRIQRVLLGFPSPQLP